MNYGEHGYVVLRVGNVGTHRPPLMAVQLDERGRLNPVKELGGMDEIQGYVTWRLYPGDRIEVVAPPSSETASLPAPQGDNWDARDACGNRPPC